MVRSIRLTASRSTSTVAAAVSRPAITVVVALRPEMERRGDHDDADHDHGCAHEYRPALGVHRVGRGGNDPGAREREGRDHRSRELRHPWTRESRREHEQDRDIGENAQQTEHGAQTSSLGLAGHGLDH
jgi:hypothetical protein